MNNATYWECSSNAQSPSGLNFSCLYKCFVSYNWILLKYAWHVDALCSGQWLHRLNALQKVKLLSISFVVKSLVSKLSADTAFLAFAAGLTLIAVDTHSLTLCIVGLCLTGLSYGSCPTMTSSFTASFYGQKYFAVNYSITNFNLIFASFIATFSNSLFISTGSYTAPFILLLCLAVGALGLNFTIKKP